MHPTLYFLQYPLLTRIIADIKGWKILSNTKIFLIISPKHRDDFSLRGNMELTLPVKQEILLARGHLADLYHPKEAQ